MHLFTTRARRPDLVPEVRPLDLFALAASRGRVPAGPGSGDRGAMARELTRASGVRIDAGPALESGRAVPPETSQPVRAVVLAAGRRIEFLLDRPTRGAWLGLVLGRSAPENAPDVARAWEGDDLPREPSAFERAVVARTLLVPILRVMLGPAAPPETAIDWSTGPADDCDALSFRDLRLVASMPDGPREVRLSIGDSAASAPLGPRPDRSILAARAALSVSLDPDRAGLRLRAGDLARLEPGDILLTDLPADDPDGLPVTVGNAPRRAGDPSGPGLKGRFGVAGTRRGVRIGPGPGVPPSDR
jgi:hypothetical protein